MSISRRQFLRLAGAALGGVPFLPTLHRAARAKSPPDGDYRALVAIFLQGGNDGNNMVVPIDDYADYNAVRGPAGLALPLPQLLPIDTSIGTYGLHPSMPELQALYQQGSLAVVCNVGTLVQPLTQDDYLTGAPRPFQLFSHADQELQWENARADNYLVRSGWAGRIADLLPLPASGFPVVTSIAGIPIFALGETTAPLTLNPAPAPLNQTLTLNGYGTAPDELARRAAFDYFRTIDRGATLVDAAAATTDQALAISAALSTDPTLQTIFPNTTLGNQLKQVAKLMKANQTDASLGVTRQIFFCQLIGFDTHTAQLTLQASLLQQLSQALAAFYNATVELGLSAQVVTFTMSEFGRTFKPSGSGASAGTDHGWGNHRLVMGDAVTAADLYGVPGFNGTVFPTLQLGGPDDTDVGSNPMGRWIPTAAVEQYGATLASWLGIGDDDMPAVFPLIGNFDPSTLPYLGFLGP